MKTLVERLRERARELYGRTRYQNDFDEAAAEIERMEARIKYLEAESINDRDESLWRFWNAKASDLAAKNAELEKALQTAREDAIGEAAKVAERVGDRGTDDWYDGEWTTAIIAKEIRALSQEKKT